MRRFVSYFGLSLLLTGCAGSLFGTAPEAVKDLKPVATRRATAAEEKRIDECLYTLFKKQQHHYAKYKRYLQELSSLRLQQSCEGLEMSMNAGQDTYVATAIIKDGDSQVKWQLKHTGEVVEQDDFSIDFAF